MFALATLGALVACAAPGPDRRDGAARDTAALSCPELADKRAAEQYQAESARLDDRDGSLFQDSSLARDFVAMDAAARRRAVEEQCQRLRSQPDAETSPSSIEP